MKVGEVYLKELNSTSLPEKSKGKLVRVEIIEVTDNLVFFKYSIDSAGVKLPYNALTKYDFLPKEEIEVYLRGFTLANKGWK